MFGTLRTLFDGANARAEERVREIYSVELIDQKIREAAAGLKSAKATLAGLMQRQRAEERHIEELDARIADLTARAQAALDGGREDLAAEAAEAIAELENERGLRAGTRDRLERRVMRLQASVEAVHRRIRDLKQGAVAARAAKAEMGMQRRLNRGLGAATSLTEAEELIHSVLSADDPFEQGQILDEIEAGLENRDAADRLGVAGFGAPVKTRGADVLARLKGAKETEKKDQNDA